MQRVLSVFWSITIFNQSYQEKFLVNQPQTLSGRIIPDNSKFMITGTVVEVSDVTRHGRTGRVASVNALNESKARLEQEIRDLTTQDKYLRGNIALLQMIPGIGIHSAAVILSEIGDFSLFQKPKQLAAYFGLDPSERQSGTFRSSKNKLSKRGSHYVRAMLHMTAHNSVYHTKNHGPDNLALAEFYEKKCQTKPTKVALCAAMHKISNIIFAVLRDQKPFEPRRPEDHARQFSHLSVA